MSGVVDYTVSLALVDFLPVALSCIGTVLLARSAQHRVAGVQRWGLLGAVLVTTGGACKAIWKIVIAATGTDVYWLDDLLFVFLMPGFALLAWALVSAVRGQQVRRTPFVGALILGAIALASHKVWPLLVGTAVFSITMTVAAVLLAKRANDNVAVGMFAFQLTVVPLLAILGSPSISQSSATQWLEESVNTLAQAALAYGALRLFGRTAISPRAVQLQEV